MKTITKRLIARSVIITDTSYNMLFCNNLTWEEYNSRDEDKDSALPMNNKRSIAIFAVLGIILFYWYSDFSQQINHTSNEKNQKQVEIKLQHIANRTT